MSDVNLPIALRPASGFPPTRVSIFDDPGDEKSWHVSQRSEGLSQYYEGREPSWYESAIAPLKGAERVLDLGCGPGLAIEALRNQGCSSLVGIDRWPAFASNSTPGVSIIAHDLSLPMPFLESGTFDGVLSHYALDYVSPICARQILREAHRLLRPGGQLVIYVASIGLGGGDEARTAAYSPAVLRAFLHESGFEGVEVEASPNGRNSVAKANRPCDGLISAGWGPEGIRTRIEGDTQLSAAFRGAGSVEFELAGSQRSAVFTFDPSTSGPDGGSPVSVCSRILRPASDGTELQLWVWRGCSPVAIDCMRVEFAATEIGIECAAGLEHVSVWRPRELPTEPTGNAYARVDELRPGDDLTDAERGAEGRQIVVESSSGLPANVGDWLGPVRSRFLIRHASRVDATAIDQEWLSGRAHGIALTTEDLQGDRMRELLLWAGWRQSLVYLSGPDWARMLAVASRRMSELQAPVVFVDPALSAKGPVTPLPPRFVAFVAAQRRFFVVLTEETRARSNPTDLGRLQGRLLFTGPMSGDDVRMEDGNETLRYLTERTVLMRLQQTSGYSPAEVGRRVTQI